MGLAEHYRSRVWEDPVDRYFRNDTTMMEFSSQVWLDVIDVLRDLSVDLSCKPDGLKEIGKGNAYGIIGINNGCVYGDMRWDIKAPVLHEYTLEYEIVSDAAKPTAHFELTEAVLLPVDKSYIPQMVDYILHKFPGSSIMTKRICTFEYYDYAF